MRGLLVGITGLLGAAAFWRRRRRRQPVELPAGPDPAEELRAKLAESRVTGDDEGVADDEADAVEPPSDPEARRKSVHDRARASIDELQG